MVSLFVVVPAFVPTLLQQFVLSRGTRSGTYSSRGGMISPDKKLVSLCRRSVGHLPLKPWRGFKKITVFV